MELKSNIKIKSNLYIRGTADGSFSFADEDYIAQINTREALMKLRARAENSGAKLKLSEKQQSILSGAGSAAGDMPSIGAIHSNNSDNSLLPESVSMRDIEEIPEAPETAQAPAAQSPGTQAQTAAQRADGSVIPETISMIGAEEPEKIPEVSAAIPETPPVIPKAEKTEIPVSMPDPSKVNAVPAEKILAVSLDEVPDEPPVEKIDTGLDGFSELTETDAEEKIVKAGLDSKIMLDSVCYSEKIKIASDRLAFIAEKYPDKRILVLCKTETAAKRISRSGEKFSGNHNINIAALDVFAAKYLSESGEPAARITALSANEKIALFGEKMHTEDFTGYDFCIIADLDEFIADNVRTLLKILVLLACGFLMLTDRRRAVLEHSHESGYGKNFAKLCDVLPESTEKLAIADTKHRLSGEIGELLTAVSAGKPADNAKKELLSKMRSADLSKLSHTDGETAVLCKNSGYARYVSLMLRKNGITHTLLTEEKTTPVRMLADILWDTHEKVIMRDNFIKRYVTRCGSDEAHADETFNMLCGMIKCSPSEGLELARLAEVIMLGGIPADLMNAASEDLTVAGINSASGLVFNTVFILADSGLINDDPGKLLYLAASGRTIPPALLKIDNIPEMISGSDNRFVYVNADQKPSFGLGDPNDVDYRSFIGGSMGDAVRKQAYISKNVKPGDNITLVLNGGAYDIVHGSTAIGKMSEAFSKSLTAEYGRKRYLETLPERIEGAYAANIFTVVSCCDPSEYEGMISPQFREHRFWYGVEIGGFGQGV